MQAAAQFRAVSVGEEAFFDRRLGEKRRRPPALQTAVLVQDVVLHDTAQHGERRLFEILHVMAVIADEAGELLQGDLVLFLAVQLVIRVVEQHVPGAPLQQGDIVFDLDGRAVLDKLLPGLFLRFTHALISCYEADLKGQ